MAAEFVLVTVILILGLAGYYSMVTYPKQRDFQKRQRYIRTLNVGDEVITYGGIIGRVLDINADQGVAHIEIAEGVVVRLVTAALMQAYDPEEIAQNAQRGGPQGRGTGERDPGIVVRTEAPPDQ